MERLIESLYGTELPWEHYYEDKKTCDLFQEVESLNHLLKLHLSTENQRLLDSLTHAWADCNARQEVIAFRNGLRFGIQLLCEVFSDGAI